MNLGWKSMLLKMYNMESARSAFGDKNLWYVEAAWLRLSQCWQKKLLLNQLKRRLATAVCDTNARKRAWSLEGYEILAESIAELKEYLATYVWLILQFIQPDAIHLDGALSLYATAWFKDAPEKPILPKNNPNFWCGWCLPVPKFVSGEP